MHLYVVSGILLIVPIVDFALAAPVLVQEKRQACADMADIPKSPITVLGKRVLIEELGDEYSENLIPKFENWFAKSESSVAHVSSSSAPSEPHHGWTDVSQPLPSIPEEPYLPEGWSPASSPDRTPSPGLSTESARLLTGMHAPLSSPVYPTYFHPDNELLGAHVSQPNTGPSNPSTEFGSDHRLVAEEPSSPTKGSSTESGFEMVNESPLSPVSSTDPNREPAKRRNRVVIPAPPGMSGMRPRASCSLRNPMTRTSLRALGL